MNKLSAEQFAAQYGQEGISSFQPLAPRKPTYGQQVVQSFEQGIDKANEGANEARASDNLAVKTGKATKFVAGLSEAATAPIAPLFSPLGKLIGYISNKIGSIPAVQEFAASPAGEATAKGAEFLADLGVVAGTATAVKTAPAASAVAKTAAQKTVSVIDNARPATKALYDRASDVVKPKPTPAKAMGEVLQAKRAITAKEVEAFRHIDLDGVNTFDQLKTRTTDAIGKLSEVVDGHLAKDPTPIPLTKLVTKTTSGSGRVIERNFVSTALDHLKELYAKTADDIGAADIDDLMQKANTTGLTRLEVNDISRLYNAEFGSKAFSKVGEPLTSVNAQAYENIRSGLKDVARQGMGGKEAAATDKVISSLYNVNKLVENNRAAVQRLQQKIAERGLLEKLGHVVAKYGDILSGGTIRGFVGGLLPRGAGYKVMNALDLEQRLSRNLEIIKKALDSGSDDAIIKAVEDLSAVK